MFLLTGEVAQYDEQDGDFTFARASKRAKPTPAIEEEPVKLAARTRKSAARAADEEPAEPAPRTRRSAARAADMEELAEPTPRTRKSTARAAEEEEAPVRRKPGRRRKASAEPEEAPATAAPKRTARRSTRRTSGETKVNGAPPREEPRADATPVQAPPQPPNVDPDGAERVALPLSDTPVINRNKEMRKKGANGSRRSSLGSRGRRASSLIDSGHTALPHREVGTGEFYKHVEEGLPEPRRMRQVLTWCGERALLEKPGLGSADSGSILGGEYWRLASWRGAALLTVVCVARAIQDQLLKDFQSKSEFSNWFDREESSPAPVARQPNPRNTEHERKIQQFEEKIKRYATAPSPRGLLSENTNARSRLREQKKMWQSLKRTRLNPEPLFPDDADMSRPPPPNEAHLDPAEQKILGTLTGAETSFAALQARTAGRLKAVEATLARRVDTFADNVHKLEQRVATAGREADRILGLGAVRLREREERERAAAGTRDVPVMEVLRSLGRIVREEDG